jgi:hypothetical protein
MTDSERIDRLEKAFDRLCDMLKRQGTELDGNWGYQPHKTEIELIRQYARGDLG